METPRTSALDNDAPRTLPKDAAAEAASIVMKLPNHGRFPWVLRHASNTDDAKALNTAGLELFRPDTPKPHVTGVPILFPGWDKLTDGKLYELFPYRPEFNFENPFFTAPEPESTTRSEAAAPPPAKDQNPPAKDPNDAAKLPNLMFFTYVHPRERFHPEYNWDIVPDGVDTKLWSGLSRFERIEHWLWIHDPMHPAEALVTGFDFLKPPHGVHPYLWAMAPRRTKVEIWLDIMNGHNRRLSPSAEGLFTMEDCEMEVATAGKRCTKLSSALPASEELISAGYHVSAIRLGAEIGQNQFTVDTISPGSGLTTCDLCGNGPPVGFTCLGCMMKD